MPETKSASTPEESEHAQAPGQELQQSSSSRKPIDDEEQALPRQELVGDKDKVNSRRQPIRDEEQANQRPGDLAAQSPPLTVSSDTAGPPLLSQKPLRRLNKVCIIRDTSGDSPNISLNCHPPANDAELWAWAAFGSVLQLGVLLYSGLATYYLKLLKDGKPIAGYAYPCTAGGTLVLMIGMFLCGWVVESSTDEKRYQADDEWQTRVVWLQQTKTVSDQVFESCMVYAKDDRQTIITSRRIQNHNTTNSTSKEARTHLVDNDDPSASLQLKAILGTIVALCGFVLQFVGLRGMHWSASVTQLGGVLVMVAVKAWVRRGLSKTPAYEPLPTGFELDSFAKTLGNIPREPWSGALNKEPCSTDKPRQPTQSSNDWIIVTGGNSTLVSVKHEQLSEDSDIDSSRKSSSASSEHTQQSEDSNIAPSRESSSAPSEHTQQSGDLGSATSGKPSLASPEHTQQSENSDNVTRRTSSVALSEHIQQSEDSDNFIRRKSSVAPSEHIQRSEGSEIVSSGAASLASPRYTQPNTLSHKDRGIVDAQAVLKARKQLARLADWRGHASAEAVSLARAIECTMDNLNKCFPKDTEELDWTLETRYMESRTQTISVQLSRGIGGWEVNATDIEAILSLWLSSVDQEESKETQSRGDSSSESKTVSTHRQPKRADDEWLRSKGTSARQSLWMLGEHTPSLARDLQWWIPRDLLKIFKVGETEVGPLRRARHVAKHRVVGLVQHEQEDGEYAHELQYLDLSNNGLECDDDASQGADHDSDTEDAEDAENDKYVNSYNDFADDSDLDLYWASVRSNEGSKVQQGIETRDGDTITESTLLGTESYRSLRSLYAMDLFSAFLRAAVKAMDKNIPGEAGEIHTNANASDTSWRLFTLQNSHLSKIVQDIHNTGLGDLSDIYLRIVVPLSVENKLPGVSAVVDLALHNAKQNEHLQRWQQAGDDLMWLLRLANRTFKKGSPVISTAVANLMDYLRLVHRILKWKMPCDSDLFESFGIGTRDLKKLHTSLQRDLELTDPTLQDMLFVKYKILGPTVTRWSGLAAHKARDLVKQMQVARIDTRDILRRTATHYVGVSRSLGDFENHYGRQYEIDAQDLLGRTALHYTCFCQGVELERVDELIRRGAVLDVRARDGATPLHYAAMRGDQDKVELLVGEGASVDVRDLSGGSPLHTAAGHGHVPVVRYLWGKAKKDLRDRSGWTALHLAAMSGNERVVDFLVGENFDQEVKDRNGRTALQLAAIAGKESAVTRLLTNGAEIESRDRTDRTGMTALHLAAKAGHMAVVQTLVERGADIEAGFETGWEQLRPLGLATREGHEDTVRLLLRLGADYRWTDGAHQNLLHHASHGPNPALVQFALDKGFDVNSKGLFDATPLHFAARNGRVSNGQLLLKNGARLNQADCSGLTPLWEAVVFEKTKFVRLLLDLRASLQVDDHMSLLSKAKEGGNKKIINLLRHHIAQSRTSLSADASSIRESHAHSTLSSEGNPGENAI
jgi:ankyrin repeat protein